jgi:hypothetical protein
VPAFAPAPARGAESAAVPRRDTAAEAAFKAFLAASAASHGQLLLEAGMSATEADTITCEAYSSEAGRRTWGMLFDRGTHLTRGAAAESCGAGGASRSTKSPGLDQSSGAGSGGDGGDGGPALGDGSV